MDASSVYLLHESDDFEPLHEPECNIVVFRYVPEFLREEAVIQGATTANPYDTVVFDNVYAEIDMEAE